MKRLEELSRKWSVKFFFSEQIPIELTDEFQKEIELYAREVAKASLENAAENANMKVVILGIEDCSQMTKSFYHTPSATEISLNKSSITNESNITLL